MKKKIKDVIFDNPTIFNFTRSILMGGMSKLRNKIGSYIDIDDTVLDACCGTGEFCSVAKNHYLGVDLCPEFIKYAKERYDKDFKIMDVNKMVLDQKYDIVMFVCSLHHFPEDENLDQILKSLNKIAKKKIIIADVILPSKLNPIAYTLCMMDRGKYIRYLGEQKRIISKYFEIEEISKVRSLFYNMSVIACSPKKIVQEI